MQQRLFQYARLGVATVKDGAVIQCAAIFLPGFDAADDKARLVEFVERTVDRNRFAIPALCPQVFTHAPAVVGDQGVGCL
ncbi:hypothetical protein D3C72_2141530 [compost metagenome]